MDTGARQKIIRGSVAAAPDAGPLENANIYLSYTTIGTTSDPSGRFNLNVPVEGVYDLVISLVGFRRQVVTVDLVTNDTLEFDILLDPSLIETLPMDVVSDPDVEWQRSLNAFTRHFIGRSEFASECRILNPEALRFEVSGDSISAQSEQLLVFENRALGYRARIGLGLFIWNTALDHGRYVIHPIFEPLGGADDDELELWMENRKRADRGSPRHLFRAILHSDSDEQGFTLYSGSLMKLERSEGARVTGSDFLAERIDSSSIIRIAFPGWVRAEFRENPVEWDIASTWQTREPVPNRPIVSYMRMTGSTALIDSTGMLLDPLSIEVLGAWGLRRLDHLMPRE